ncbi:hypothetical protein V8F33_004455 [Rhypophila sp. PSN 637]
MTGSLTLTYMPTLAGFSFHLWTVSLSATYSQNEVPHVRGLEKTYIRTEELTTTDRCSCRDLSPRISLSRAGLSATWNVFLVVRDINEDSMIATAAMNLFVDFSRMDSCGPSRYSWS